MVVFIFSVNLSFVSIVINYMFHLLGSSWIKVKMFITGKAGVNFYTQIKTITQQWKDLPAGVSLAMPTSQK